MKTSPLDSVAEVIRGITFSKADGSTVPEEGRLPVIRAGSIQQTLLLDEGQIWVPSNKFKSHQLIKKNDIIMCTSSGSSNLVGKCAKSDQDWNGSFGAFCAGIRVDDSKCDSSYLYHFLCSPWFRNWTKSSSGANIKNIRASELAKFKIPVPPLKEQKRIAIILDKADTIRRKRQQAIQLADEFLHAVFLDMFGDPVTNQKNLEKEPLANSLTDARNGMSRRAKADDSNKNIVLRLQDIRVEGIRIDNPSRITLSDADKERYQLDLGDITFIRVNGNKDYVGRSAVFYGYKEPVYFNDHIIRLRFNKNYNPRFLSRIFNSRAGKHLMAKQIKTSAGQYTISQSGIEQIIMIKPPRHLQDKFAYLESAVYKQMKSNHKHADITNHAFLALQQRAFRGEL